MRTEFLIVGQGICGTFLAWQLQRAGRSFIMIDEAAPDAASRVASGIINPITGRRVVKTWMIDELMPYACKVYREIEEWLSVECFRETAIVDCFPSAQMRLAFLERLENEPHYLSLPANENDRLEQLNYGLGYGMISPSYLVDLPALLAAFRKKVSGACLLEERFDLNLLSAGEEGIRYGDITAERILFCDGRNGTENPLFERLPWALSKGEALIVEIPDLSREYIYKKGISIAPWQKDLFWVGSSYEWNFDDDQPTEAFRIRTTQLLRDFIKLPFKVVDYKASLRPGTLERRPFVGWHPLNPRIGIFNGMGTKGCSLAPYFAAQLAENITQGLPILPAADIGRFKRILSAPA